MDHRTDAEATILAARDTLDQLTGRATPTDVSIANASRAQAIATAAVAQAILALADARTPDDTQARFFAGMHRSAEETVSRVISLHETWTATGPPPLGTSLNRWWDNRLVELAAAINP